LAAAVAWAGIHRVVLPNPNQKDLRELREFVRAEMEFVFAEKFDDGLEAAIPELAARLAEPKPA
jgi:ATP-dependent Lon protease